MWLVPLHFGTCNNDFETGTVPSLRHLYRPIAVISRVEKHVSPAVQPAGVGSHPLKWTLLGYC